MTKESAASRITFGVKVRSSDGKETDERLVHSGDAGSGSYKGRKVLLGPNHNGNTIANFKHHA